MLGRAAEMKKLLSLIAVFAFLSCANAAGPTTQPVNSPAQSLANLTVYGVDLHTATGDVATIAIPSYVTAYQVTAFKVTNCSATPVLASIGLFTGAGGTGTTVVTSATITGATSASVVLSQAIASTARLTSSSLFVRLTVANVAVLTCDLKVSIEDFS
jgi:hypothetical protein